MPLTAKGSEIKGAMTKEYGEKKGEQVFYASKNAGKISGVDAQHDADTYESKLDAAAARCDALGHRMDGLERRDAERRLDVDD